MTRTKSFITCLALLAMSSAVVAADDDGFVPLFNGKNLDGFIQHNGKAKYTVETVDGQPAIVGRTVPNEPNSFLCSENDYGDFLLEL